MWDLYFQLTCDNRQSTELDEGKRMDFVSFNSLPTILLGYLRARIISGELPEGQKIHENELASKLKLSRGPLREAFRILEQERLVVNIPRRGTFVTELSQEDLGEIYQVRRMIELSALDLLEEKGVTELPTAAKTLREAEALRTPNDNDRDEFLVFREKITDFHARLVMEASNSRLSHYYQTLYFSLARYQYLHLHLKLPGSVERLSEDHHKILELISAGRHKDAKVFLLDHLEYAQQTQENALRKRPARQP